MDTTALKSSILLSAYNIELAQGKLHNKFAMMNFNMLMARLEDFTQSEQQLQDIADRLKAVEEVVAENVPQLVDSLTDSVTYLYEAYNTENYKEPSE